LSFQCVNQPPSFAGGGVEIIEHVLHSSEHQFFFRDYWGIEIAIATAAHRFPYHEALSDKVADSDRNRADADVGQMALNFHGGAAAKLPEDFHDFLLAWAEYLEESFGCHYGFTAYSANQKNTAPIMPQAPAIIPKIGTANHNKPKITPIKT
jgi:hypothetical protein